MLGLSFTASFFSCKHILSSLTSVLVWPADTMSGIVVEPNVHSNLLYTLNVVDFHHPWSQEIVTGTPNHEIMWALAHRSSFV